MKVNAYATSKSWHQSVCPCGAKAQDKISDADLEESATRLIIFFSGPQSKIYSDRSLGIRAYYPPVQSRGLTTLNILQIFVLGRPMKIVILYFGDMSCRKIIENVIAQNFGSMCF